MQPAPSNIRKTVQGIVQQGAFGTGSKSEHQAYYLLTNNGRLLLRRKGASAYQDDELLRLVDKQVVCDGFLVENMLLAEEVKEVKQS